MKDKYYYALFVEEKEGQGERMIWKTPEPTKHGRQYFFAGTGILPCIYYSAQSGWAEIKKARKDFDEGAQFYVRKVTIELI